MTNYYHGTEAAAAHAILTSGFSLASEQWGRGWGNGVYLSGTPDFAATWGDFIVACGLREGTRILWHEPHDPKTIAQLRREFGADITKPDFWKIVPGNKQFTKTEIINLWRYLIEHYYVGQKRFQRGRFDRFTNEYSRIYEQLKRHQFDGVGFRADADWPEMLIFNPSDVMPQTVHKWSRQKQALGALIPPRRLANQVKRPNADSDS